MLKSQFKMVVLLVVASLVNPSHLLADEKKDHDEKKSETQTTESGGGNRQVNPFSKYDTLKERLEALSKKAPTQVTQPKLVEGKENLVKITPSRQQFSDGAETLKRVKWYRERMAESCKDSDKSSELLGQFMDGCLTDFIFNIVKSDAESNEAQNSQTTFELDAKRVRECRDEMNSYFDAKKTKVGTTEWSKFAVDQEIKEKLEKFFNWYGASAQGIKVDENKPPSKMIEELKKEQASNLCFIENEKAKQDNKVKLPEVDPKKLAGPNPGQKPYQGPGQPSQDFKPPQVQTPGVQTPPPQTPAYQPPQGGYQPPQGGYQGGNYDPSGIGYRGKYDPRDRRRYDYDNFRDYGGRDNDPSLYVPLMNYPKGSNYIPPSNNNFPARSAPPPPVSGPAPIAPAPFLGRGLNFGFGYSNYSGYPYGGYFPPMYGGYGGGYGAVPYGGVGIGIGGGYVPVTPIVEPITPCGGMIGGCGGGIMSGCGGGLMTPCGGVCGGGLINPLMPCGNNLLFSPIGQFPNRNMLPRVPGTQYPWNPYYNYGQMPPNRFNIPRNPGSPWQPVIPGNPTVPGTPGNPGTPGTPGNPGNPVTPIYTPGTNPIGTNPIRITIPRNQ